MPAGRPSKYKAEYADQAYKFALLGATNAKMAELFDVGITTFDRWWLAHDEFRGAITRGRAIADAQMAESLWHRGRGYSHEAVKIFLPPGATEPVIVPYIEHYPPDTQAASLWLRNRQPALWRDKQEVEHKHVVSVDDLTDEQLDALIARGIGGVGERQVETPKLPTQPKGVVH